MIQSNNCHPGIAKIDRFDAQGKKPWSLMHWNYPDFKEIYTVHCSNLAYMFRMYI
jgi:hypothetical protein